MYASLGALSQRPVQALFRFSDSRRNRPLFLSVHVTRRNPPKLAGVSTPPVFSPVAGSYGPLLSYGGMSTVMKSAIARVIGDRSYFSIPAQEMTQQRSVRPLHAQAMHVSLQSNLSPKPGR